MREAERDSAIETALAHAMLDKYRRNGEWFAVAPDAAVGTIHAAAYRRGQPVLDPRWGSTVEALGQLNLLTLLPAPP